MNQLKGRPRELKKIIELTKQKKNQDDTNKKVEYERTLGKK